jgi:hypothetical protein
LIARGQTSFGGFPNINSQSKTLCAKIKQSEKLKVRQHIRLFRLTLIAMTAKTT